MAKNKIIFGDTILLDLTSDTVTASKLAYGFTAHDRSGDVITGTSTLDSDTTDANATSNDILSGKTAYVNKNKVTGEMPNRGAIAGTITTKSQEYTVQNGYHDGSGKVSIDSTEQAKIIAENIKKDIVILGVTGTYEGGGTPSSIAKTVTPYITAKTYDPAEDNVDYYSGVTVSAIYYNETPNTWGTTVTIGTVAP